jgi:hypothetical protein
MSGGNTMQSLPDINQLMKLAASPAGQKLLALLQNDTSINLKQLQQDASAGNLTDAKKHLSAFLASEQAHALIKELESGHERTGG